jgi:hypothetical protein
MCRTLFAAIIIVGLVLPSICFGYSGGSGTTEEPYQIATAEDLNDIGNHPEDWGKHFILVNDVNLAGYTGTQFRIIGNSTTTFTGVFDGNNRRVLNFTWNSSGRSYIGLFGYVGIEGQIKNVALENVSINAVSGNYTGGLVGWNKGSINNCYSTSAVSGSQYVGGLVGYNIEGSISNCYSMGSVSGSSSSYYVGGLVGRNSSGSINNCYSTGAITGRSYLGGLVGYNYFGSISNCYSMGSVSGSSSSYYVGGLVGRNSSSSINNCYSTSTVSGIRYVGGLAGRNSSSSISQCYSMGTVSGSSSTGGLVGENSGSISGCYFLITSGPTNGLGTPKTDAQMKQQSSFLGWDFTNETANGANDYWRMCVDGLYYPHFRWEYSSYGDFVCPDGVDFYDFAVFADQWLLEKLPADVAPGTGDGIVNFIDYAVFADGWQSINDMNDLADFASQWLKPSAYCADIAPAPGGDGVVNMLDLAIFAQHWLE